MSSKMLVAALAGALLLSPAGCGTSGTADEPGERRTFDGTPAEAIEPDAPAGEFEEEPDVQHREPATCPTRRAHSWTLHEPTTVLGGVSRIDAMAPADLVVARTGTATVAYQAARSLARTADDPPTKDDSLDPSNGGQDTYVSLSGDGLAFDAVDTQTLTYQHSVRFEVETSTAISDLVVTDRALGGSWSATPTRVEDTRLHRTDLAVNSSGAAVVMWMEDVTPGGDLRLRAIYRPAASAAWTAPQRVPARNAFNYDVAIDDAGRILLAHDRIYDNHAGVYAIRRTAAGVWKNPRQLSGRDTELFHMALSPTGAAIVSHGPVDGDGASTGGLYASRMTPRGTWRPPHRQPHGLGLHGLDIDERGRVLISGWDGDTVRGRWSRPDGRWRRPFTIAANIGDTGRWGLAPQVAVNRRGDAVASWVTGRPTPQAWATYKPAGGEWTRARRLTPLNNPPQVLRTAIGECGHVAFAWATPGHPRKLHLRRGSPRP